MVRLFFLEKEEAGKTLVERLDPLFDVRAALWILESASERWRLLLGIKEVDSLGRKRVYQRVQTRVRGIPHLSLSDVEVISPDDPFLKVMRRTITTGKKLTKVHLSGNVANGRQVEDAFVYRLM